MYCRKCGASNFTDSGICTGCGQIQHTIPAANSPVRPQTQVAYPYNYPLQAPYGQVPTTPATVPATMIAPPPPTPVPYRLKKSAATKSVGLTNVLEIVLPGAGFMYAGDAGGGAVVFTGTLLFIIIGFICASVLHGLALFCVLIALLAWLVIRLVVVNHVVKGRNTQGVIRKSSTVAGFLECICPGMGCFYARKVGTGFALLCSTLVAVVGAGFITYELIVQVYQSFNNTPAGVIYNLCAKNPGCTNTTGPDFTSVSIFLTTAGVILIIWMIARIAIAVNVVEKQKKSPYSWRTIY